MDWLSYSTPLLQGAVVTVQLAVMSTLLGAVVSFALGMGRLSRSRLLRMPSIAVIELFRGTSLLVQLFWLYFALPLLGKAIGLDLRMPPVTAGVLALGLNIGAYGAEVVRGAVQAVPRSQHEAAKALDFTPWQIMWRIALPGLEVMQAQAVGSGVIAFDGLDRRWRACRLQRRRRNPRDAGEQQGQQGLPEKMHGDTP